MFCLVLGHPSLAMEWANSWEVRWGTCSCPAYITKQKKSLHAICGGAEKVRNTKDHSLFCRRMILSWVNISDWFIMIHTAFDDLKFPDLTIGTLAITLVSKSRLWSLKHVKAINHERDSWCVRDSGEFETFWNGWTWICRFQNVSDII